MKVESYPQVLLDHSARAYEAAADDTLNAARDLAPRRSGAYVASLARTTTEQGDVLRSSIGSSLPQGGAVEHGANVGARRGPHMAGAHAVEQATRHYPEHMTRRLQETPV